MRFKRSERVIYMRNPLVEVVCQIRFPRILQIDLELPATFQTRIAKQYPLIEVAEIAVASPLSSSEEANESTRGSLIEREFHFFDAEKKWQVSLSSSFLALSAHSSYERWEGFRDRLQQVLQVLVDIYSPPIYTRLGLRYKDIIVRKTLGLDGQSWVDLVCPWLTGVLSAPGFDATTVQGSGTHAVVVLDTGTLTLRSEIVTNLKSADKGLLIDSDFHFEGQLDAHDARTLGRLDDFNEQAGAVFRWCISDRLHQALGPQRVD